MPRRSRSAKVFDITARLCLAVVRDALSTMRMAYPKADVIDYLICLSALVGHFEGRPMNPSKIAAFTGIPRPTVIRRVKALVAGRMLEFASGGRAIVTPMSRLVGDAPRELSTSYVRYIRNAVAELSKMDT